MTQTTPDRDSEDHTYLVLGATGKQGRATVNALLAKGITSIVVSSRNPESNSAKNLLELEGVNKIVKADNSDVESIVSAIQESGATRLWFTTDFWSIPYFSRTRASEAKLGANVIDAIKKAGTIQHVVYSSIGDADSEKVSTKVGPFCGKADIEKYMTKELDLDAGITWSVIRPVVAFDNVDNAAYRNPLKKGHAKMFFHADKPIKYISGADIGKGSAVLLTEASTYKGRIIEAASANITGVELAEALSEASGTECNYSMFMSRCALRFLVGGDMFHMVNFIETEGFSANIEDFKKIVPDVMDAKAFFLSKGKWADGEAFESLNKV
jgi:uncharacterized protein YbjT (DUF2867 family)